MGGGDIEAAAERPAAWLEHRLGGSGEAGGLHGTNHGGPRGAQITDGPVGNSTRSAFILFMESKCHTQIHVPPEPQDVMLFEKSPFVDIISYEKVIQDLGVVVHTDTHRGGQRMPNSSGAGRGKEGLIPRAFGRGRALGLLQSSGRTEACCCEPPGGAFVAALGGH